MTSPDPCNWTFRPAVISEAEEACAVIRRSIIELCGADHDGNPAILDRWLANKTPDQVRQWIEANPGGVLAGTGGTGMGGAGIGGVGMVMPDGRIAFVWRQARVPNAPGHSLDGSGGAGLCRTAGRRAQV